MECAVENCQLLKHKNRPYCLDHIRSKGRELQAKRRNTEEYKQYMEKTREIRLAQYKLYRENNKEHLKEIDRKNYYKNHERNLSNAKEYRNKNKDIINEKVAIWRKQNPDKVKQLNKKYYKENYGKVLNSVYKRELSLRNATIYEHLLIKIEEIYNNCPDNMVVDHIVPLQNKNVCGLHVPWNLTYLDPEENNFKRNKFDGTYDNNSWKINKLEKSVFCQ